MPRNTREWAHRKITMARGNLDTAFQHLTDVTLVYKEHHPEITDNIEKLQELLKVIDDGLDYLYKSF